MSLTSIQSAVKGGLIGKESGVEEFFYNKKNGEESYGSTENWVIEEEDRRTDGI